MHKRLALEISVESVETALAAERGGANRIELCSELAVGGTTPDAALMSEARASLRLPIFAMIRPRGGDFVYSKDEFASMRASIREAKQLRMDGVVLGILTAERRVDVDRTRELVELAAGMEVTFHRAIDEAADLSRAFGEVLQSGAGRILTSGGQATALGGADAIADMVKNAKGRIVILPGAGINPDNILEVARRTGAREFHSGLSSVLGRPPDIGRFEAEVRRLAEQLRGNSAGTA